MAELTPRITRALLDYRTWDPRHHTHAQRVECGQRLADAVMAELSGLLSRLVEAEAERDLSTAVLDTVNRFFTAKSYMDQQQAGAALYAAYAAYEAFTQGEEKIMEETFDRLPESAFEPTRILSRIPFDVEVYITPQYMYVDKDRRCFIDGNHGYSSRPGSCPQVGITRRYVPRNGDGTPVTGMAEYFEANISRSGNWVWSYAPALMQSMKDLLPIKQIIER